MNCQFLKQCLSTFSFAKTVNFIFYLVVNYYNFQFSIWFQVVILVSQIRVNSMAVTRTKSSDVHSVVDKFGKLSGSMITDNVEQVRISFSFCSLTT